MKRVLATIVGLLCAASITLSAADAPKKKELTDEQKKMQKELLEKYDTNKDGKLDRQERAKMIAEDKEKATKAGMGGQRRQQPPPETK
jgi:Ca2+-binding EF-hand superfamily protein